MVLVDQWDDLGQPRPASAKIIPPGGMIFVDWWDDFGPTIPIPPLFNSMIHGYSSLNVAMSRITCWMIRAFS